MERRFTEEQVSEIIRRAAEHAGGTTRDGAVLGGITESELKRIAHEIGLPSDSIDRAIQETHEVTANDTGNDLTYERTFERRIHGEVGDEAYATLVEHFHPEWGIGRGTSQVGSMLSYRSLVGINQCRVSVSQKAGTTTLKVASGAWLSLVASFLPATILSVLALLVVLNSPGQESADRAFAFGVAFLAIWTAAIFLNVRLVRSSNRKTARLADGAATDLAASADHLRRRLSSTQTTTHELQQDLRLK